MVAKPNLTQPDLWRRVGSGGVLRVVYFWQFILFTGGAAGRAGIAQFGWRGSRAQGWAGHMIGND